VLTLVAYTFSSEIGAIPWQVFMNRMLAIFAIWVTALLGLAQSRAHEAEERALQAERLAAIGQAVTSMAHESRNFLQRICAAIDFLNEIEKDNPEALEEVARIQTAEKGLEQLLEDLRQFAAPTMLEKERCSLQDVWQEAWSHVKAAGKNRSSAQFDEVIHELDLHCHIDGFRIRQVFYNLFENSFAACGDDPHIEVHCQKDDATLKISVRDNGPGLTSEQQRHVFEPFFTTKSKGTGLGMAIAKRIIEAHGGVIRVEREYTEGAEFVISLPLGIG
jgi:signal transduction histidine kinase